MGRSPEQINLGALIRDVEDDMALVECHTSDTQCRISSGCVLNGVVADALKAFLAVFDRYTLADLLEARGDLARLMDIDLNAPVSARRVGR